MSSLFKFIIFCLISYGGYLVYLEFNKATPLEPYNKDLALSAMPVQILTRRELKAQKKKITKGTKEVQDIIIQLEDGTLVIRPRAEYRLTARVLSKERYYMGWAGEIAPYDLALSWGDLAKKDYDTVDISQRGRWYYFKPESDSPYSIDEIYVNSANNHIIPGSKNLRKLIAQLDKYDVVHLEGYLVEVFGTYKNGSAKWNSSLSRTDRGDHSCELFYVKRAIYENNIYE